jgi:hypothetical protein
MYGPAACRERETVSLGCVVLHLCIRSLIAPDHHGYPRHPEEEPQRRDRAVDGWRLHADQSAPLIELTPLAARDPDDQDDEGPMPPGEPPQPLALPRYEPKQLQMPTLTQSLTTHVVKHDDGALFGEWDRPKLART